MPKINDMTDAQIAGFFYLALWNDEISKLLTAYPNAAPVLKQTGPTGFYLWNQQFGYPNAAASTALITESIDLIANYPAKSRAIDKKFEVLQQKLPLLKRSEDATLNDVLLCWFGMFAIASKSSNIRTIKNYLEQFYARMTAYALKCNASADIDVTGEFMPALSNVMLRHLGADRLNFITALIAVSFFDADRKVSILRDQSPEVRQTVLEYIRKTPAVSSDSEAILQVFSEELPKLKQEDINTEASRNKKAFGHNPA